MLLSARHGCEHPFLKQNSIRGEFIDSQWTALMCLASCKTYVCVVML